MTIHLLSIPNTEPTEDYYLDGFCTRTRLFAQLLTAIGHRVILYGVGQTDIEVDQFVPVLTDEERRAFIGSTPYQGVPFDANTPLFLTFNSRAGQAIRERKGPQDVICTIGGSSQYLVSEMNPDLQLVEYSIGYRGVCAPFRVFQSHAWRHVVAGFTGCDGGREFDAVIPPWFPVQEFPFVASPDDYVAYCGRLVPAKGITTVCDSAREAGVKLVVMGFGDPSLVTYGEYVGDVDPIQRNAWLSKARAVVMPTQYIEPFGNVSAEAQLCGTPMITTDYGAFTESVEHGVTGYRCTSLGEFVQAIDRVSDLDRRAIRARAVRLYGPEAAEIAYRGYFRRLATVGKDGWRSLQPGLETAMRLECVA